MQEEPGAFDHRVDIKPTLTGRNISVHIWQKNSDPASHTTSYLCDGLMPSA